MSDEEYSVKQALKGEGERWPRSRFYKTSTVNDALVLPHGRGLQAMKEPASFDGEGDREP